MTSIDWKDTRYADDIRVDMIDPHSYKIVGELPGVIRERSSLTWGYYTDNRMTGTIEVVGYDKYIPHSLLRIVHVITKNNYERSLATCLVSSDNLSYSEGSISTVYELSSMLATIEHDCFSKHLVIGSKVQMKQAISGILSGRPHRIESNFNNYTFTASRIFELGISKRSMLYDICETSNNRMDVTGDGKISFDSYIPPSKQTPKYVIDISAADTLALDDLSRSSNSLSVPTTAIISFKGSIGEGKDIEIAAEWSSVGPESAAMRGYRKVELTTVSELKPATQAGALAAAKEKVKTLCAPHIEWELSLLYIPISAGDVVTLVIPAGRYKGEHKCLVKDINLDLGTMIQKLSLKEITDE